jgi:hypothetical protein
MKTIILLTALTLSGCATMHEQNITAMDVLMGLIALKASGVVDDSYSDIDRWNNQYYQTIYNERMNRSW